MCYGTDLQPGGVLPFHGLVLGDFPELLEEVKCRRYRLLLQVRQSASVAMKECVSASNKRGVGAGGQFQVAMKDQS